MEDSKFFKEGMTLKSVIGLVLADAKTSL